MTPEQKREKKREWGREGRAVVVFAKQASGFYWDAPDNIPATCELCGDTGKERPHNPKDASRVCSDCILEIVEDHDQIVMTPQTAAEVASYRNRN